MKRNKKSKIKNMQIEKMKMMMSKQEIIVQRTRMNIKGNYQKVMDKLRSLKNMWLAITISMRNRKIVKITDYKKLKLNIKILNKMVHHKIEKNKSKMVLKCLKTENFLKIVIMFQKTKKQLLFQLFRQKFLIKKYRKAQ